MKKRAVSNIKLNLLKGKMRAEGCSLRTLAPRIGLSPSTLCLKLNGLADFTGTEIFNLCNELHIRVEDVGKYFFPQMFPKETFMYLDKRLEQLG